MRKTSKALTLNKVNKETINIKYSLYNLTFTSNVIACRKYHS